MAGAEEARSFADLTARLLDSSAREQQGRIDRHGDLDAQRQSMPWNAVPMAEDAFFKGRDLRRREMMQNLEMTSQDIANQRAQGSLSEEQARRQAMDTSSDGGPTARERQIAAQTSGLESEAAQSKFVAQHMEENQQLASQRAIDAHKLTSAQLAESHFTLGSAQADREAELLRLQIAGIHGDLNMSPEEKQAQEQKITQSFIDHNRNIDQNVVRGIVNTERNNVVRATAQYQHANEVLVTSSPEYGDLKRALEPLTPQVQSLNALDNDFKAYSGYAAANLGPLGQVESPQSQAALQSFADHVAAIDPNLAAAAKSNVGLDLKTTAQKLAGIRDEAYRHVQGSWDSAKSTLTPTMQRRPEAQAIDQSLNRIRNPGASASMPNPWNPQQATAGPPARKFLTPIPGAQAPGTAQGGNMVQPQPAVQGQPAVPNPYSGQQPMMNWSPYRQGGQ